jgi:eukaryotic-like serine/threonine-protein kinase
MRSTAATSRSRCCGRFVREIEIAAKLSHPHILPLFDSGETDGILYYVMPFVEGESLRERLKRETRIPAAETARIVDQIASALTYAHERGVTHRDVKPENILLAGDQAILADFGIARAVALAGGDRMTYTGLVVGTPSCMSPEQAYGTEEVGPPSDIYALGCVLYEMLAGRSPFEGDLPQAIIAKHAAQPVPPLPTSDGAVPATVERVVRRALAKEPAGRFPTANGLASALADAITPQARLAEARRAMRRTWVLGLAVLAMIAALLVGGRSLFNGLGTRPIQQLAVLPASNMTRDPAQDYFVDGVHEALVGELQRAGLAITARQSVLQYRDSDKPIRQIAQELGVDALIELSVGRDSDSVIVDVGLYDGRSQLPHWTESFPTHVAGVLALYRDVSRRIAREVGAALSPDAERRLSERPTVDPRAYDAVLQGEFHLRRFTPQDLTLALQYFESALAIDSTYAPAHLGVAKVWGYRAQAGLAPTQETMPRFDLHLQRALALDPGLASARAAEAARLVWGEWDLDAGELAYRHVLEMDPNDAESQAFYGHVLMIRGDFDGAVQHGELALRIDPLNAFVIGLHGAILNSVGRPDEAITLVRDMLARNPGQQFGVGVLSNALYATGRLEEQLQLEREQIDARGDTQLVAAMDSGLARGGVPAAWHAEADVLATRAKNGFASPWKIAQLYTAAGEPDAAIDWLETAVAQRDQNIPYLGVIPSLRPLHDNPRFQQLARSVGIPLEPVQ